MNEEALWTIFGFGLLFRMKMVHGIVLCYAIFYSLIVPVPTARPLIIMTASGPVRGKLNKYNNMEYYSYQGIPFAENSNGSLRFMPPVPRKPWTKVLDATRESLVCPQGVARYKLHQMSEDCLNINIYVPASGIERLLPVSVVIHGGALQFLSGNSDYIYGPQFILERDIIVISINYRLGPLGFLSLNIKEAPGNAALKDVILSLKWIQQNIRHFGGDPNTVTLIGHSSGAVLVHYLMLTKKSEGLFQKVILLSGSALSPRAFARYPKTVSLALAQELGIKTNNVYEILRQLHKIDVHEIIKASENLGKYDDNVLRQFSAFVPSVEKESPHAVMTVDPIKFFREHEKLPINVTIMAGIVAQEGLSMIPTILLSPGGVEKLRKNSENCIPSNIEYPLNSQRSKQLGLSIGELYFGQEMLNFTVTGVTELASDTQYVYGIHYWVKQLKSMKDSNPLYYYIFDFDGDLNWTKMNYYIFMRGTAHSDEMGYIFVTKATKSRIATANARSLRMINTMMNLMSNFIYYGNPTPDGCTGNSCIRWPDYGSNQTYMLIGDNLAVKTFASCELDSRMKFWEKAYNEYYEYVDKGGKIQYKIYP